MNGCSSLHTNITNTDTQREVLADRHQQDSVRKLVIFMDGTGNDNSTDTNIFQMYQMSVKKAKGGAAIMPFYIKGVGTAWYNRIFGGSMGKGLDGKIREAYLWLVKNYKAKDEIFIFGFSRGAYSARSLNGLIEFAGLLDKNKISAKGLNNHIEKLYREYNSNNDGKPGFEERLRKKLSKQAKGKTVDSKVVVTAIGLFDTVPALGLKQDDFPDNHRTDLYAQFGFHAISIDEQRYDFRLLRFDPDKISAQQILKEVWFSGAHADVGGGYKDHEGLESLARNWMLKQFVQFDIFENNADAIDCSSKATCENGYLHDEFLDSGLFNKLGISRRKPLHNDMLHGSVRCRINRLKPLDKNNKLREPDGKYMPYTLKAPVEDYYQFIPYDCHY